MTRSRNTAPCSKARSNRFARLFVVYPLRQVVRYLLIEPARVLIDEWLLLLSIAFPALAAR